MNKLQIAIIGCGWITRDVHVPHLKRIPKIKLRACMDVVEEVARERYEQGQADYYTTDLTRIWEDPEVDAVMIATRPDSHVQLCIDAARAGKPVFCEKPMGVKLSECYELVKVLRDTKTPYMIGYCYRFNKAVEHVRSVVTPDFSLAHVMTTTPGKTYQGYIDNLCHALDLLYYFHRSEPSELLVQGNRPWPCPVEETTGRMAINLHFSNGSFAVIVLGENAPSEHLGKWYYKFCTSEGTTAEVIGYRRATLRPQTGQDFENEGSYYSGHLKELKLFADAVLDGRPMPITQEDGLRVNRMMEAVRFSYETEQSVHLDSLSQPGKE